MQSPPSLNIFLDDSIGLGHKMRTFALYDEWLRRGGTVTFHKTPPAGLCIAVFDGYRIPPKTIQTWGELGHLTVYWDDGIKNMPSDVTINYHFGAERLKYQSPKKLIGPQYFPVRSDYKKLTPKESSDPFDCESVDRKLNPAEFAEKVANAKYIICPASVKMYEAMYLKKAILLHPPVDNQMVAYRYVIHNDIALPNTPRNRKAMDMATNRRMYSMQNFVDGNGANMLIVALLEEYRKKIDANNQAN